MAEATPVAEESARDRSSFHQIFTETRTYRSLTKSSPEIEVLLTR